MNTTDISAIKSPADIRQMDEKQLKDLSVAMRKALLDKLSAHGGHVGPNLGMIEAIIALHYVFNTPEDKIVCDEIFFLFAVCANDPVSRLFLPEYHGQTVTTNENLRYRADRKYTDVFLYPAYLCFARYNFAGGYI